MGESSKFTFSVLLEALPDDVVGRVTPIFEQLGFEVLGDATSRQVPRVDLILTASGPSPDSTTSDFPVSEKILYIDTSTETEQPDGVSLATFLDIVAACQCLMKELGDNGGAPALDMSMLERYTAGDRGLQRDVLSLFTPTAMGYWQQLCQASDAKAWHDAAHSLKGTARGLGAAKLEQLAAEAETVKEMPQLWDDFRHKLRRAILQVHLFVHDNLSGDG